MLRALATRPATGCFLARSFGPSANVTFVLIVTFLSGRTEFCEASEGRPQGVAPTIRVREHLTEDECPGCLPPRNAIGMGSAIAAAPPALSGAEVLRARSTNPGALGGRAVGG